MKNNVQALLQYSYAPLEPIVALTVTKNYQSYLQVIYKNQRAASAQIQKEGFAYKADETDERWFSHYE